MFSRNFCFFSLGMSYRNLSHIFSEFSRVTFRKLHATFWEFFRLFSRCLPLGFQELPQVFSRNFLCCLCPSMFFRNLPRSFLGFFLFVSRNFPFLFTWNFSPSPPSPFTFFLVLFCFYFFPRVLPRNLIES